MSSSSSSHISHPDALLPRHLVSPVSFEKKEIIHPSQSSAPVGANEIITFTVDSAGYLDLNDIDIQMEISATGGTNPALVAGLPWGCIQRLQMTIGGNLFLDIDYYNLLYALYSLTCREMNEFLSVGAASENIATNAVRRVDNATTVIKVFEARLLPKALFNFSSHLPMHLIQGGIVITLQMASDVLATETSASTSVASYRNAKLRYTLLKPEKSFMKGIESKYENEAYEIHVDAYSSNLQSVTGPGTLTIPCAYQAPKGILQVLRVTANLSSNTVVDKLYNYPSYGLNSCQWRMGSEQQISQNLVLNAAGAGGANTGGAGAMIKNLINFWGKSNFKQLGSTTLGGLSVPLWNNATVYYNKDPSVANVATEQFMMACNFDNLKDEEFVNTAPEYSANSNIQADFVSFGAPVTTSTCHTFIKYGTKCSIHKGTVNIQR